MLREKEIRMADLIERSRAIVNYQEVCRNVSCNECPFLVNDGYYKTGSQKTDCRLEKFLHNLPSAQPEKCSDILDELKADDYYNYIHTGYSRFSEVDWDYLIHNAKEKEKLHERLDIKTGGNRCAK